MIEEKVAAIVSLSVVAIIIAIMCKATSRRDADNVPAPTNKLEEISDTVNANPMGCKAVIVVILLIMIFLIEYFCPGYFTQYFTQ